jgi:hypothetical protein
MCRPMRAWFAHTGPDGARPKNCCLIVIVAMINDYVIERELCYTLIISAAGQTAFRKGACGSSC